MMKKAMERFLDNRRELATPLGNITEPNIYYD
jgi:hypothetical protein